MSVCRAEWGLNLDWRFCARPICLVFFQRKWKRPFLCCIIPCLCCFTCNLCSYEPAVWPLVQLPHQSKDNSTLVLLFAATHSILFYRKWVSSRRDTILNFPAHFLTLQLSSLSACIQCSLHYSFFVRYITAGNPLCKEDSTGGIQNQTADFQTDYSETTFKYFQVLGCIVCMKKEQ